MNKKDYLATLLRSTRVPFLVLVPVCVALAASVSQVSAWHWQSLGLALLGAVLAHASVNALNEYLDFRSGLDLNTRRTGFSGGSGALPEHPGAAYGVLVLAIVTLLLTVMIGLYFVATVGLGILWVGIPGVLLVLTYTSWLNRQPWLCWMAPGIGFGVLMISGVQYVLQGSYSLPGLLAGLVVCFPVNNLLLLNQFPDIDADRDAGRRHGPIAWGVAFSTHLYLAGVALTLLCVAVGVLGGYFPATSWLALVPLVLALHAWRGARRFGKEIGSAPQYLAANVLATLLTPATLALTLWWQ